MMETVISGFTDVFPKFLRPRKTLFTLFCCVVGYLVGLPQVTKVSLLFYFYFLFIVFASPVFIKILLNNTYRFSHSYV